MKSEILPALTLSRDGEISFLNINVCFSAQTLTPAHCRLHLKEYCTGEWDVKTGYLWLYYKASLEGERAWIGFCFYGNKLSLFTVSVSLPSDKLESNWPTEETSLRHVAFIKKAFEKQLEGKINYGEVYHALDAKSFSAQCGISYHKYE